MRSRAAIDPDASTTKITRLPSRPSRIARRTSLGPTASRPTPPWLPAAASTVPNTWTPWPASGSSVAEIAVPVRFLARDRRPGAPSPTPGTTSALVRNVADGWALGLVPDWPLDAVDEFDEFPSGAAPSVESGESPPPPGGSGRARARRPPRLPARPAPSPRRADRDRVPDRRTGPGDAGAAGRVRRRPGCPPP